MQRRDQVYGAPHGLPLRYDFVGPDAPGPHPLIVCIHGGGWISGDKCDMWEIARIFAGRGFAAACPQYRLAPLHPFPAAVEDVREFVRHARINADDLGIRADAIGAFGISAGGHLAAMAGLGRDDSRVDAVVDVCGISDVTDPRERHLPISWSFLEQFMGSPWEGSEERYREASPVTHAAPGAPPFLLIHGEEDDVVPISQSETLLAALQANGGDATLERFPGEGHSFSLYAWPRIEALCVDFFGRHLSR